MNRSSAWKIIRSLKQDIVSSKKQDIQIVGNHVIAQRKFIPSATFEKVFSSDARVKICVGPYGSGKSSAFCNYIIKSVCEMPRFVDGVRRARWAVVRNTKTSLIATFRKTWMYWFSHLGSLKERQAPKHSCYYIFNDGKGRIELELLFFGLCREDDVDELESLELSGAYFNEVRHIPHSIFIHMNERLGRFPPPNDLVGTYKPRLIADTNAPDITHWLPTVEAQELKDYEFFHQPPALLEDDKGVWTVNSDAENLKNLSKDYYASMLIGTTREFKRVYGQGHYGLTKVGQPVFSSYNDDIHSSTSLDFEEGFEVLVAWDYGTVSPCCVMFQFVNGQLRSLKEFVGEYTTIRQFASDVVIPWINSNLSGYKIISIGDPANTFEGTTVLNELGFKTKSALTNKIGLRLEAVNCFLTTLTKGMPNLTIHRKNCQTLRKGFAGWYSLQRVRVNGTDMYKDVPEKVHPYSDVHDCLQYAALHYRRTLKINARNFDVSDFIKSR